MKPSEELVDVVVLGAGLAGYRAAIRAASHGVRTLVLEKMPQAGGSSIVAAGFFAFAGTQTQKARGLQDSGELLRKDLLDVGQGANDPALVDAFVARQAEEFDYLRSLGVDFADPIPSSGHSVPRGHRADPKQFMALMAAQIAKSPLIALETDARAKRLLRDPSSGRIVAVRAVVAGRERTVRARKGIVIATGGFSRGKELLSLFAPHVAGAIPAGGRGSEGDGMRMAWEHGAAFADLAYINGTFGTYPFPDADESPFTIYPVYRGAIAVNMRGERFVNESKSYKTLGEAVLLQARGIAFQVFDDAVMRQSGAGSYDFKSVYDRGRIASAASLDELAAKIEVPSDNLRRTVSDYNRDAATGIDERFGRVALSHTYGKIAPLVSPPFFAYPSTAMLSSTYGGLRVDARMQVLNVWNEPIAGLYAAGEVIGGFHGASYMTGSALSKALVFGRIAADGVVEA